MIIDIRKPYGQELVLKHSCEDDRRASDDAENVFTPKNKGNLVRRISRELCAEMPQNFGLMADGQSSMDQRVKALNCVFTAAARPALWAPSPGREGTAWKRH